MSPRRATNSFTSATEAFPSTSSHSKSPRLCCPPSFAARALVADGLGIRLDSVERGVLSADVFEDVLGRLLPTAERTENDRFVCLAEVGSRFDAGLVQPAGAFSPDVANAGEVESSSSTPYSTRFRASLMAVVVVDGNRSPSSRWSSRGEAFGRVEQPFGGFDLPADVAGTDGVALRDLVLVEFARPVFEQAGGFQRGEPVLERVVLELRGHAAEELLLTLVGDFGVSLAVTRAKIELYMSGVRETR